jgi:Fic family protein
LCFTKEQDLGKVKAYLQAAVVVSNLAPITTSDSSAIKGRETHLRKLLKSKQNTKLEREREGQREIERDRENQRDTERDIRARTDGPEDRVSPFCVETDASEGLMKGHHPNSFFAPI